MVVPLIGAALGAFGSYAAAREQSKAQDKANAANMAGFNQYKPYVDAGLSGGQDAFNNTLNAGYYQGPTLAGPNPYETGAMNAAGAASSGVMGTGRNIFNQGVGGFGNNQMLFNRAMNNANQIGSYQPFFDQNIADQRNIGDRFSNMSDRVGGLANRFAGFQDQYGQLGSDLRGYEGQFGGLANQQQGITDDFRTMAENAGRDRIAAANEYAVSNAGSLVDAMLRDDRRRLEENTLTGINQSASGTGNVNSSRAGIADAVANRAFDDRRADMTADTVDRLRREKLQQDALAFNQQSSALNSAGSSLSNTGALTSNAMNTINNQGNMVGAGANMLNNQISGVGASGNMLGNAGSSYGNAANAAGAAVGNFGAANNALNTAGGFNDRTTAGMDTGLNMMNAGYNMGTTAGAGLRGFDQARLNDERARFEGDRDFAYNRYKDYMSGMLGRAPSTANEYRANTASPGAAAVFGGMQGFGFGQQYGPQLQNMLPTNMGGYGSYGGGAPPARPTSYGGPI